MDTILHQKILVIFQAIIWEIKFFDFSALSSKWPLLRVQLSFQKSFNCQNALEDMYFKA